MRNWLIFAAINGFMGVAAGPLGAHLLAGTLDAHALSLVATAERYQMWHALALGLVAVLGMRAAPAPGLLRLAAWLFAAGIALFSYSLYGLALTGWRALAMATPVGGLALMAGWAALAGFALTRGNRDTT